MGFAVRTWTGQLTSLNRARFALSKTHALDALCVGDVAMVSGSAQPVLWVRAMGRGHRRMSTSNRFGFPIAHRSRCKEMFGYQTGDIVRALIRRGPTELSLVGRVTVRSTPKFQLNGRRVHPKHLRRLQRSDGYAYELSPRER